MGETTPTDQTAPLSPAPSNNGDSGIRALESFNNSTPPQDQLQIDPSNINVTSHPASGMSTPGLQLGMGPHFDHNGLPPLHQYQQLVQYNNQYIGYPPGYGQGDGSEYPEPPHDAYLPGQPQAYTTPASSPSRRSEVINLRSGTVKRNSTMRPLSAKTSRVEKSTQKKKKPKAPRRTTALTKPLSELTKDAIHLPIIDIAAYVNRPAEERKREVATGKVPGKVKRPMNAFMLYRKAYQNRTKEYCTHNNHQVVSQVCGESWPLETQEYRDQFAEWARIERGNHQLAFPEYKFMPSKSKTPKKKVEEVEEEGSGLEDFDYRGGNAGYRNHSNRGTPAPDQGRYRKPTPQGRVEMPYYGVYRGVQPPPRHFQQHPQHGMPLMPQYNRSNFQVSNPTKPLPGPYDPNMMGQGQYYEAVVHDTQHGHLRGLSQDVRYQKTPSPSNAYYHQPQYAIPHQSQQYAPQADHRQYGASPEPQQYYGPPPGQQQQYGHQHQQPEHRQDFDPAMGGPATMSPSMIAQDEWYHNHDPLNIQQHDLGPSMPAMQGFNNQDNHDDSVMGAGLQHFSGSGLQQDQNMQLLRGQKDDWEVTAAVTTEDLALAGMDTGPMGSVMPWDDDERQNADPKDLLVDPSL